MTQTDRFIVVTGGPGSGKTTLLAALARRGVVVMPEAGRAVIRDEMAKGGLALPWADRLRFARRMLDHDLACHERARRETRPVFFDRGIPDIAGYLDLCGLPRPGRLIAAMARCRYRPQVLIAPPWREIFASDAERRQDFDEARRTDAAMRAVYRGLGYALIELPLADLATRLDFVSRAFPDLAGGNG
jgi:predicted ATPase